MRTLIISEGSKDNIFLKKLFSEIGVKVADEKIEFFDQEATATSNQKGHAETYKMRKFGDLEYEEYPYKILVKSEGGKKPALTVFKGLIGHAKRVQMLLLLDLDNKDGRNLDKDVEKLKEKIGQQLTSRQYVILRWEEFEKTSNLITLKAVIAPKQRRSLDATTETPFYLTFFKTSMEKEAGINKSDANDVKIEKIDKLFRGCPGIAAHFTTIFEKMGIMKSLR